MNISTQWQTRPGLGVLEWGELPEAQLAAAQQLAYTEAMWGGRGMHRARSHCRFVRPLIHFTPDSLTYSVPLFLKRQCDRTLGMHGVVARVPPVVKAGDAAAPPAEIKVRKTSSWPRSWANLSPL
jgi:hypothetical protein